MSPRQCGVPHPCLARASSLLGGFAGFRSGLRGQSHSSCPNSRVLLGILHQSHGFVVAARWVGKMQSSTRPRKTQDPLVNENPRLLQRTRTSKMQDLKSLVFTGSILVSEWAPNYMLIVASCRVLATQQVWVVRSWPYQWLPLAACTLLVAIGMTLTPAWHWLLHDINTWNQYEGMSTRLCFL